MIKTENFEKVQVQSSQELRTWLELHHTQSKSVWLVTFKKQVGDAYLSRDAVLDQLLCFGWIDGIRRKLDEDRTMQLISPRKTHAWSQSYKQRAERLEAEGLMHEAGRRSIDEGKASGLWDFMKDVDALIVPKDLAAAFEANPPAWDHWNNFSPSSRRNMLRRIKISKTDTVRAKRTVKTAILAAENRKVPQT